MFRRHPSASAIDASTCRRAGASLDRRPKSPRRRQSLRCKTALGPIGNIPPAEAEANHYAASENLDMAA